LAGGFPLAFGEGFYAPAGQLSSISALNGQIVAAVCRWLRRAQPDQHFRGNSILSDDILMTTHAAQFPLDKIGIDRFSAFSTRSPARPSVAAFSPRIS